MYISKSQMSVVAQLIDQTATADRPRIEKSPKEPG
jgi:hypothetical protein